MTISGVVFDVGGTITLSRDGLDFEVANASSAADFLHKRGLLTYQERYVSTLLTWHREKPRAEQDHRQINSTKEILAAVAQEQGLCLPVEILPELEAAYNSPYIQGVQPLPRIHEVIERLRGRYRLAVVSNARSDALIKGIVAKLGLLEAFDPFLTSEAVGWRKPSPRIFRAVLDYWAASPNEVVMVGDSLYKDVAGARAVGMRAILLAKTSSQIDDGTANAVAESLDQLPELIAQL